MQGKSQRFLLEVETKILAKKTTLIALFCFTAYFLVLSTTPQLFAVEPAESKVNTSAKGGLDRIAKAKPDLELVNFTAMRLAALVKGQ